MLITLCKLASALGVMEPDLAEGTIARFPYTLAL